MQRQISARALMPPPRPLSAIRNQPANRNQSVKKLPVSTSSNTSYSTSSVSSQSRGVSNARTDHNSNLSSNSDAHKPRRKRRPKKKKQVCSPLHLLQFGFCIFSQIISHFAVWIGFSNACFRLLLPWFTRNRRTTHSLQFSHFNNILRFRFSYQQSEWYWCDYS